MKFTEEFIERVREANDLVGLISQYTQLRPSGHQLMGLCPFPDHSEKSPSFSVSQTKQVYHCFGCKKSGTIFTFLQTYSGMSFPEAIAFLARRGGVPLPAAPENARSQAQTEAKWQALKINKLAVEFYHQNLLSLSASHPARQYVKKRNLSEALISKFQLGYAPSEWGELVGRIEKARVPLRGAEQIGLIKGKSGARHGYFDVFRDRLMFPIFSAMGDSVGFGGRILGEGQPKYLNSPESAVFSKGKILYGLHETAKYVRAQDQIIIVEGYMDFLALYGAGICNLAATMGTALTPHHARLIRRYTLNVLVLFDGDSAGQDAAERSLPLLLEEGLRVKGLILPERLDPDDFIRQHGAPGLQQKITQASDLFSLLLQREMRGHSGQSADKVAVVDKFGPLLASIKDFRLRDLYRNELADHLNVESTWLRQALLPYGRPLATNQPRSGDLRPMGKAQASVRGEGAGRREGALEPKATSDGVESAPTANVEESPKILVERAPRAEVLLVNLALKSEDLLKQILNSPIQEQMSHPAMREIMQAIAAKYRQSPEDFDKLSICLASRVQPSSVVTEHLGPLLSQSSPSEDRELLHDCLKSIQDQYLKSRAQALARDLRGEIRAGDLEQFMDIQRNRRNLRKEKIE